MAPELEEGEEDQLQLAHVRLFPAAVDSHAQVQHHVPAGQWNRREEEKWGGSRVAMGVGWWGVGCVCGGAWG